MTLIDNYIQTWVEVRTRFSNQLETIKDFDLKKKLGASPNSAGFLIRHIADVEMLFAKNVFGESELKVHAKSVAAGKDSGEWTDLNALLVYQNEAFEILKSVLQKQIDNDWSQAISTKEFGTRTKAEAIGRIISHTAYHAGQLALILKYGA
jgi:uncharacterized damage-inducible protein DinB